MELELKKSTASARIKSMLRVDLRRMFTSPLFYIMAGISLVMPILILVMTTMMDGTVTVNPQTKVETVMEGFDNVWQAISSTTAESGSMNMSLTSMCNMNLIFFMSAVLVCLFVGDDFRSGYAKNLFTVRAKKGDYIISKTLVLFLCGVIMLLAFFIGALLGGVIAGLSFETTASVGEIALCLLSKCLLMAVFIAIFLLMSVIGKQKVWLSMLLSFGVGMLLFMMIPALTPLDATIINAILCLSGGAIFSVGMGLIGKTVLDKTALV